MEKEFFLKSQSVSAWRNKNEYDYKHVDISLTDYDPAIDNQNAVSIDFSRIPNNDYLPNTTYRVVITDGNDNPTDVDHQYRIVFVSHGTEDEEDIYSIQLISDKSDSGHWAEATLNGIILSDEELHWLKIGTKVQITLYVE